jgi:cytochrome P450
VRIFAAVACTALAWPALRAAASRAVWRAYPVFAWELVGALVIYATAAGVAVALLPSSVVLAIGALAVGLCVTLVSLSRPSSGRTRRLPPGSLTPIALGPWSDPEFLLRQARRHGPVFKTMQIVRPMACVADLQLGRRLLDEHDAELEAPPLPFSRFIPGGFLRWRSHESHAYYKQVFRRAFSRDVVLACEEPLRAGMRASLAQMAADGAVPPRARINRMLFPLWVRLFLGLDDAAELKQLSKALDVRKAHRLRERRARRAVARAGEIVRGAPRDKPSFVSEVSDDELDDPAVVGSLFYLMLLTWADVSGLLTWIVRMLADNPEAIARVRADESSAVAVVRETLRLSQSEYLYRRTLQDLDVGELRIPRGWLLRVCVREAHRDPTVFERPAEFDPERFNGQTHGRDQYSPFGAYRLACLGEHVAVEVARWWTLELARYELRVVRDGPVEFGSWSHWRPSRKLRVAFDPVRV